MNASRQLEQLNRCLADLLPRSDAEELSPEEGELLGKLAARAMRPTRGGGRECPRGKAAPRGTGFGAAARPRHVCRPGPACPPPLHHGRGTVTQKAQQLVEAAAAIQQQLAAFAATPAPTLKGRLQQVRGRDGERRRRRGGNHCCRSSPQRARPARINRCSKATGAAGGGTRCTCWSPACRRPPSASNADSGALTARAAQATLEGLPPL
jgi:hypothetical protein